jgi:hypothetical protein
VRVTIIGGGVMGLMLHPMYRAAVTAKDASFAALWNASPAG